MRSRPSSTRTRRPASSNRRAAASPATPAPTMMASYVIMWTGIILGWPGNGRLQLSVGDGLDRSGAGAHAAVRGHREPGPDPAPGEALLAAQPLGVAAHRPPPAHVVVVLGSAGRGPLDLRALRLRPDGARGSGGRQPH